MPEKRKRLLAVDDDARILSIVQLVALELGFEVETLVDSAKFMTTYVRMKPDIITLDVVMPNMDGIELIRWLGDVGCAASTIIVSGGSPLYVRLSQKLAEARGSLRTSILSKPFSIADLRAALMAAAQDPATSDEVACKALSADGVHSARLRRSV